jgi:hypothetical protein
MRVMQGIAFLLKRLQPAPWNFAAHSFQYRGTHCGSRPVLEVSSPCWKRARAKDFRVLLKSAITLSDAQRYGISKGTVLVKSSNSIPEQYD